MKVSSSRGSALLVSILLMMILSFMMIFLIERILPYSRTVRGIENSVQASYIARSLTEDILTKLRADNPAGVKNGTLLTTTASGAVGNESRVLDSDTMIPSPGYGSSEGDPQWNAIGPGRPAQLILGANVGNLSGLKIEFRVPQFGSGATVANTSIANTGTGVLIGFSLSNSWTTLMMASCNPGDNRGFISSDVNRTDIGEFGSYCIQKVGGTSGITSFANYLNSNPTFCSNTCTLKLSVLRALKKENGEVIPYIEYRVRWAGSLSGWAATSCFLQYGTPGQTDADCGTGFRLSNPIPLQTSTITSTAQVWGFKKVDTRVLEQVTTTEGLDFTVFQ